MSDLAVQKTALPAMQMNEAELLNVLRYDGETGLIHWVVRSGKAKAGSVAGTVKLGGYVQISVRGKLHYAHRIAWLFVHGEWPAGHIDHVDGNPLNNRIGNLRDVSVKENMENQRHAHVSNKSSGLLGVSFDKQTGRWMAKISVGGSTRNLGRFADPCVAHAAYVSAKREYHKGGML
jgi:hypothetical protein